MNSRKASSAPRRPWWSLAEAADALGVKPADLLDLGVCGWGPRYVQEQWGRKYRPADVRAWAAKGSCTAGEARG